MSESRPVPGRFAHIDLRAIADLVPQPAQTGLNIALSYQRDPALHLCWRWLSRPVQTAVIVALTKRGARP
jgi:hypothetical protein